MAILFREGAPSPRGRNRRFVRRRYRQIGWRSLVRAGRIVARTIRRGRGILGRGGKSVVASQQAASQVGVFGVGAASATSTEGSMSLAGRVARICCATAPNVP